MDAHACPLKFGSCKLFSQVRTMDLPGLFPHSFRTYILYVNKHNMGGSLLEKTGMLWSTYTFVLTD